VRLVAVGDERQHESHPVAVGPCAAPSEYMTHTVVSACKIVAVVVSVADGCAAVLVVVASSILVVVIVAPAAHALEDEAD